MKTLHHRDSTGIKQRLHKLRNAVILLGTKATYGDGNPVNAGPCEVAYINERIVMRPDFLEACCRKVAQYNVDIFA